MASRFQSKSIVREHTENTRRNRISMKRPEAVPRWLKQRVTDHILKVVGESAVPINDFVFGEHFLPGRVIEVLWQHKVPADAPFELSLWYGHFHLRHSQADWGFDPLGNGYKYRWWLDRYRPRWNVPPGISLPDFILRG